ncbi:unnamed protein product, partial [marine sediment metagenome]
VIDLENHLVLDKVVYPAMVLALGFSFLWPGLGVVSWLGGGALSRVLSALAGGTLGFAALALPWVIYRRGMGLGDVKLGGLVGLMTGYPLVLVAWLLAVITGGVVGAILLAFKIRKRKDPIPFATFLATSAMVTLLWGQAIYQWYL